MNLTEPRRVKPTWALLFFAAGLVVGLGCGCGGARADELDTALAAMPRPWEKRMHRLTLPEYRATMEYWAARYASLCSLEVRGRSSSGLPVYMLKITDPAVADEDKQVCLITALHGGPERSGTTTELRLMQWLLGDSSEAREIRKKQVILAMPIMNPYGYFVTDRFGNEQKLDTYNPGQGAWNLAELKLSDPKKTPEIAALLGVVDQYRPEMHADLHGTGLQAIPDAQLGDRTMYEGQTMFVEAMGAISNNALRPWDWRINEVVDDAARAAGYGLDRNEADAQRSFWGPGFAPIADRVWTARPSFYTAHYGYAKYHTMVATFEMGWEESGLARMRALLGIGNRVWLDENTPGYPVEKMRSYLGFFVTTYGKTAAARRESRAELWLKQGSFSVSGIYPQTDGHGLFVCARTAEALAAVDPDLHKFGANLEKLPGVDAGIVQRFMAAGPEEMLVTQAPSPGHPPAAPIEHGVGLRVRIPYRHPQLLDIRLNGVRVRPDEWDGYHTWYADGWTELQINVPPAKARELGIMVVTYAYKPDAVRNYGFDPPPAVMAKLNSRSK